MTKISVGRLIIKEVIKVSFLFPQITIRGVIFWTMLSMPIFGCSVDTSLFPEDSRKTLIMIT